MTRPLSGKRGHAPAPCCDLGSRITAQIISSLIETRPPLPDLVLTNCRVPEDVEALLASTSPELWP